MPASGGANRRRSERVMLQIPIVLMTETLDHEQMKEETHTLVVNAHGGLLKLEKEVLAGPADCTDEPALRGESGGARGTRGESARRIHRGSV